MKYKLHRSEVVHRAHVVEASARSVQRAVALVDQARNLVHAIRLQRQVRNLQEGDLKPTGRPSAKR